MKKFIVLIFLFVAVGFTQAFAMLPLSGKLIVIDVGHGGKDAGTSYQNVLEKDLNLAIAFKLKDELIKSGSDVIMTREGDYDLASPDASRRKKSDFDNRIKLINDSQADLYISVHINYLDDSSYSGAQVFYEGDNNKTLATNISPNVKLASYYLQEQLNMISYPRSIKPMPNIYMYQYLKIPGVLVECGFISNTFERKKLQDESYQQLLATTITKGVINYFT